MMCSLYRRRFMNDRSHKLADTIWCVVCCAFTATLHADFSPTHEFENCHQRKGAGMFRMFENRGKFEWNLFPHRFQLHSMQFRKKRDRAIDNLIDLLNFTIKQCYLSQWLLKTEPETTSIALKIIIIRWIPQMFGICSNENGETAQIHSKPLIYTVKFILLISIIHSSWVKTPNPWAKLTWMSWVEGDCGLLLSAYGMYIKQRWALNGFVEYINDGSALNTYAQHFNIYTCNTTSGMNVPKRVRNQNGQSKLKMKYTKERERATAIHK